MNITKENIDALNLVVKFDIGPDDYQYKVTKVLKDYRMKAEFPGFRKGHVPMGMLKKQYGKSVMIDEVNKLLQYSLNKFLTEEKLDILGNPLPRMQEDFSWDSNSFSFEFELGLAPKFDINLKSKKKVTQYNIVANKDLIDSEIENIQTRYGKISSLDEATEHSNLTGTFVNEEKEINKKSTFLVNDLKGKKNKKKVIGAKVGDVIELNIKELFEDDYKLQYILGVPYNEIRDLDISVQLTIQEITKTESADLDKELFDKLFPDGSVNTVTELRDKIKEDEEEKFQQQADHQLLDAVAKHLVENIKFDLPTKFLQKWLATVGEKELSPEEATEKYYEYEKRMRYQLIERKIIKDNDITLHYEDMLDCAKKSIRFEMAQLGNMNTEEKELDNIAVKILQNQDYTNKLQDQLMNQKLLAFFKENMSFKIKEVSFRGFIKEVYG